MLKLNTVFDADSFFYSLSYFECKGHMVHVLNSIYCAPLTSTVKLSLFMQMHSSPLFLAARLHQCHSVLIILIIDRLFPRHLKIKYRLVVAKVKEKLGGGLL